MRFTKEELPGVSETLGNNDACITTSVSIRAVVKPVLEMSMFLASRRFLFMSTQFFKNVHDKLTVGYWQSRIFDKKVIQSFEL